MVEFIKLSVTKEKCYAIVSTSKNIDDYEPLLKFMTTNFKLP